MSLRSCLLAGCGEGRLLAVTARRTGRAAAAACSLLLAPFWLGSLLLTYFVTAHLPSCIIRLADGSAGCGEGRLFAVKAGFGGSQEFGGTLARDVCGGEGVC